MPPQTKYHKPEFGQNKNTIQEVCGRFLCTSRAVYNTMQHALNELCIAATKGTLRNTGRTRILPQLLCNTHTEAEIIYSASEMILTVDNGAAYQDAPTSRSRASGYHYLGNLDDKQ